MVIELLSSQPLAGTICERHYDVSARTNTWVRFDDEEGGEWVGIFGSAELAQYSSAVPFADDGGRTALILSRGQGYIVDTSSGVLLRKTPWDYACAAVGVPGRDFIVVANTTEIWATDRATDRYVRREGRAWYDDDRGPVPTRVALDGIILEHVTGTELTGRVWEMDGWYAFRVDLETLAFRRGALLTADWEAGGKPTAPAV